MQQVDVSIQAAVYRLTEAGTFAKDFGLRNQTRRAAVSIMSNVAEGFERGGRSEFHQYLKIAKGSCAELRSSMYVAFDAHYIDRSSFTQLIDKAEEVARIIGGLRAAVQKQKALQPQSSALSPQS